MDGELTVAILREIRDGVRETRDEVRQTNLRLDDTNLRLDQTNLRLEKVEEALRDLAGQQVLLGRYVKNVVDRHEEAITDLRERVVQLETKVGRDA